jgi:hypothetical protein
MSLTHSLFEEEWWLDATAPGNWDAAQIVAGDEVIGRLPYVRKRRFGFTALGQPPLTQALGPWISSSSAKYCNRLSRENEIVSGLIDKLPRHDLFSQSFHWSISNWLPFYWQGFEQMTRYTYVIEPLTDLAAIWNEMGANVRTHIRKAEKKLRVITEPNVDRLYDVNSLTFQRQHISVPYSLNFLKSLDAACEKRSARKMFFAIDEQGRCHHALYLVFDSRSAFNIVSGGDPELRRSGAASLLMWEAIKHAATVTNRFDFEGSMLPSVEPFVRDFGARQVPYFYLRRKSPRLRIAWAIRELFAKSSFSVRQQPKPSSLPTPKPVMTESKN